jgi:hypothetical protein
MAYEMPVLLDPFIDPKGKRWFDPSSAEKHINKATTRATLAVWAELGRSPFGLPIKSMRVPLLMTSHGSGQYKPRHPRKDRPVISEDTVLALDAIFREVFHDKRREGRGGYSIDELKALRVATKRYRAQKRLPASNP